MAHMTHNDARRQAPDTAKLQLLERFWRMRRVASGRILDCGIYQTVRGLEVRAGYNPEDLLYSKPVEDFTHGRRLAEDLRATMLRVKGFEQLPEKLLE